MNFGEWETVAFHDPRLIDCHAHAHILLTSPFVRACDHAFFFRVLKGRIDQRRNYFERNAHLVCAERIQKPEFDSKQMDQFSLRLTDVENAVQVIKDDTKLMKVEMKSRMRQMETLLDNIQKLLMKKLSKEGH